MTSHLPQVGRVLTPNPLPSMATPLGKCIIFWCDWWLR